MGDPRAGTPLAGGADILETEGQGFVSGLAAPLRGFRFTATFENLGTASFKSVQGFSVNVDNSEYREGAFAFLTKRKVPGLVSYDDMTLEKGLYSNALLYEYFMEFLEGKSVTPSNAEIVVYDNSGTPTAKWYVKHAWPVSYRSGDLSADDSSILIESLTMAHEGISRETATMT